jgi:hypothetical protein
MFISNNPDQKLTVLAKAGGGGAVIAKTHKAILIGIYDPEKKMSDDQP